MATWHQARNLSALAELWAPHPTKWKCITDKVGKPASSMTFGDEASARAYAERTGDVLIAPLNDPEVQRLLEQYRGRPNNDKENEHGN